MSIDLHLHSWFSDGLISPEEVARNAHRVGHTLMALTDHDTTAGVEAAAEEARRLGLMSVPGVELTTSHPAPGTEEIHLLGYWVSPEDAGLRSVCQKINAAQRRRLAAVIERLRARGWETTVDEIERSAPHTHALDRPHLARIMAQRGWVPTTLTAFKLHLGGTGDCHVPLEGPTAVEAIAAIRDAGGLAVLAHPIFFNWPTGATAGTLAPLVKAGLGGLESYHARHTHEQAERFDALAREFNLVVTGGTDCHGARHSDGSLGIEHPCVPEWVGEQFLERTADFAKT